MRLSTVLVGMLLWLPATGAPVGGGNHAAVKAEGSPQEGRGDAALILDLPGGPDFTDELDFGRRFAEVALVAPVPEEPDWFLRMEYATPSNSTLGDVVGGEISLMSGNESYSLTIGRYLKRDVHDWPLDISLNGSIGLHPSNAFQEDIYQYLIWLQIQWTEFPWNDHLRTKVGVGEGLSYFSEISYSEMVRRDFTESRRLLNYLEFSISLNLQDLFAVTRLDRIVPVADSEVLENVWLVGSLHHRSGGWGLFGDYIDSDGVSQPVTGGDNLFVIGVQMEF